MSRKCDCVNDDGTPCQNEATRECEECNLDKVMCEQHIHTCMVCGAEVAACCSEPCNYNDWHYDLCVPCAKHDKDHEVLLEMFPEDEELREILGVDEEGEEGEEGEDVDQDEGQPITWNGPNLLDRCRQQHPESDGGTSVLQPDGTWLLWVRCRGGDVARYRGWANGDLVRMVGSQDGRP